MAGFTWSTPPQTAWPQGVQAYARAVRAGIHGVMQRWAPEIENWMRSNRPWVDRTSNAVQGLYTAVEPATAAEVVDIIELIMAHGVKYGWELEGFLPDGTPMARGPRWAVVLPALDHFGPLIWRDIRELFA